MRNLANLTNEQLFDLMIEVYEPYSAIISDKDVKEALKQGFSEGAKVIKKKHMKEAIEICALMDGVPVEGYKMGLFTFMRRFSELLSEDYGFDEVFQQPQTQTDGASSGNAMANIEESAM
jgi:hypothetical protein